MIANVIQILTNEGQSLTDQIRKNVVKVTGKTAQSLGYEVTSTKDTSTLTITAKPFFRVVETGRKPTPDKKPSKEMIENISDWVRALGKEQKIVWAIATSIQQKGTKLYRDCGRKDVFSNVLSDKNIAKLERTVFDELAKYTLDQFIIDLKKNKLTD